jgi:hypothetical protein
MAARSDVVPNAAAREALATGKRRIKPNYLRKTLRLPPLDRPTWQCSTASRRPARAGYGNTLSISSSRGTARDGASPFNRVVVVRYRISSNFAIGSEHDPQQQVALRRSRT